MKMTKMDENSFSLVDLYPKWVINSKGEKKPFDETSISKVLNKETGLDMSLATEVSEDVVRKIIGLNVDEITTNYIRELVCVELTQRGMNKYRNLFARAINLENISFKIEESFLEQFKSAQPDWGPLGYITYKRTYARILENEDRKEEFWETIRRVVEGCYSIQKEHCMKLSLPWSDKKAQKSAQRMFQKIWEFKMSPPGRGLWMMGTEFIARHGSMALNNCGFASTADIDLKYTKAFEFVMDALMLGVGVGFDTKGAGKIVIKKPKEGKFDYQIPDSREGWVEALKYTLEAFFLGKQLPNLDYSLIRPAGEPIRGFGGIASGPEPLKDMLVSITDILQNRINNPITSLDILDIMNNIGKCVVAGNVRRSAEIALGNPMDLDFITAKQDKDKLYAYRWASNNSVFAIKGLDYSFIADQITKNGEPGILWLENARAYSRMGDKPDYKDKKVAGVNPCITGDTLIAVADGRNAISIKQLAEEGKDVPVYCKDNKGITKIRMMRNPRITGYNEKIYEVRLDDGSIIKCTGNHKFILRNNKIKTTEELQKGDSLMLSTKWQTTWSEIMGEDKKKKSVYWMTNNGKKNIFEHTLFYQQINGKKIPKGFVLHHKDKNGLNNNYKNLELLSKERHDALHDISGQNNPMVFWWNNASKEEKESYRQSMAEAVSGEKNPNYSGFTDEEIYQRMLSIIRKTDLPLTHPDWRKFSRKWGMPHTSPRWGKSQTPMHLIRKANDECGFDSYNNPATMREYKRYLKRLKITDLDIFFDKCTYVKKKCELCNREFVVKWGLREQAYCSTKCSNKVAAKRAGIVTKELSHERHKKIRLQMIEIFEDYVSNKQIIPSKREFLRELKKHDINDFRTAGFPDSYQKFLELISKKYDSEKINTKKLQSNKYRINIANHLKDVGLCFNHKIVSVNFIGHDTVYNGTVDEFHNYGIMLNEKETQSGRPKLEMIFTRNCGEQSLESFELCCLVETFPSRHDSYEELQETLKYAYLYAKSVTLVNTHWKETNAVMLKNRRMGISQTGIIEAFVKHGRRNVLNWCDKGYDYLRKLDAKYSDWLCIPKSIKITTVKPSGTVSLLPGVSPGIHYPHSQYYIRRIRISKNSDLINVVREAGYKIEDDKYSKNSYVVEFPVHKVNFDRSKNDVSIWEQAENAAAYQKYWSDNQVSITITFTPDEANQVKHVLECYEDKLKSASFLPIKEHGYEQAPYEEITKERYEEMVSKITPMSLNETRDRAIGEKFCDSDKCEIVYK